MTLLGEVLREAREIPSLEVLADKVENETKAILAREGKEMSGGSTSVQHKSVADIAAEISRRTVLPYLITHKISIPENHKTFLDKLANLKKIKDRLTKEFSTFDTSVNRLLNHFGEGVKEIYEMIYQGCCDIYFQRVSGVKPERKDVPEDYMPSSDKLRCYTSPREGNYLLVFCDESAEDEEIYD